MIFNFYLFNKSGTCIYYEEWSRKKGSKNLVEEQKLMYGMLWSLKSFCSKISPSPCDSFNHYRTNTYKLHFFETLTGLKFVLLTDPQVGDIKDCLKNIYSIYVQYVIKNPLYKLNEVIDCELFVVNLTKYVQSLPYYNS